MSDTDKKLVKSTEPVGGMPAHAGTTGAAAPPPGGTEIESPAVAGTSADEDIYLAPQWKLVWWKFLEHKVALVSGAVLILLYLSGIFCGFISPYDPGARDVDYVLGPPQRVRFDPLPFVYAIEGTIDYEQARRTYVEDTSQKYRIKFFVRSHTYSFWGLFDTDLHLFGVEEGGRVHLLGTDRLGRDLFTRILYGARVSLSVGLIGVFMGLLLGVVLGGIGGYFGGVTDAVIQRTAEVIRSYPVIPLWMGLAAALPDDWSPLMVYFGVTLILSFRTWTSMARQTRGKILSLRNEDFVLAAELAGAGTGRILGVHLIPNFLSHIIARLTLAIPGMIIGETSLSFLGLGLRDPVISWGVLLQKAQNIYAIANSPWLLLPGLMVIISVLCFNFLGDGLRDAADPYTAAK